MAFLDLVKQRYSCRSYQERSVEQQKLDYVMECVRLAPSAVNKQPWMFRVVSSPADKAKLQECYNREWFNTAPMYIICSILHDQEWVRKDGKHHGDDNEESTGNAADGRGHGESPPRTRMRKLYQARWTDCVAHSPNGELG